MKVIKLTFLLYLFSGITMSHSCFSQSYENGGNSVSSNQTEFVFGVGFTNLIGELGGANKFGTHYLPVDIELKATRTSAFFGFKRASHPRLTTSLIATYGMLFGSDTFTDEPFRKYRNSTVRSHLFEASFHIEFNFLVKKTRHSLYKSYRSYILSGFSSFGYIPQGKRDNKWINLRPLSTEGQNLNGTGEYSKFSFGIPIGFGHEWSLNKELKFAIEVIFTQTFTDYIDDVGGFYYDNKLIEANNGTTAAYFADRSNGTHPNWTSHGSIRGSPNHKDGYAFINFLVVRKMSSGKIGKSRKKVYNLNL